MYAPHPETTTSTAIIVLTYDPNRRYAAIHNLSGETCYHGKKGVTTAAGMPIFNNDIVEFGSMFGNDPTLERWVIGSTGGDIRINEE